MRQGDDQFADIVRWTLFAMIEAEEYGITSKNVDEMLKSDHPTIKSILGVTPGLGKALGVDEKWVYDIVRQVGNDGESYDRNIGDGSLLKIPQPQWAVDQGRHSVRAADPLTGGKTGRKNEQEPDHSGPTFGRLQVRNSLLHCRQDHSSEGRGTTAVSRGTERMAVEALGSAPRVKVAPWNDPVIRGWVFQIVVVGLVGLLAWYLVSNTIDNLERQKIASGFHYLDREAGFEIGDTMIEYSPASTYARAIYVGMLNTLRVSVLGVIMATILGTLLGVGRLSNNWLLSKICEWYVEAFRNVPLLLWLFLFYKLISEAFPGPRQAIGVLWNSVFLSNRGLYFPVPLTEPIHKWMGVALLIGIAAAWGLHRWARKRQDATGQPFPSISAGFGLVIGLPFVVWLLGGAPHHLSWPELKGFNFEGGTVIQPEFTALLLGLVLYTSAFVAEIVRSGILALHKGQSEAAMAIGLSRGQVMRLVLLPQALRVIVPPMTSQYLNIVKNSSLAIAIGYPDLVASINVTINQTGQAIENVLIIMAAYLSVSLSISAFMNWYNKRIALRER